MSYAPGRRHRSQRGASLGLPPNFFARTWELVRNPEVLIRLGLFVAAALLVWVITGGGVRPPNFRTGDVPPRKIVAQVDFQLKDDAETAKRKQEARRTAETIYVNNVRLLEERRQELTNKVGRLVQAETLDAVKANAELKTIWEEFLPPGTAAADEEKRRFETLKTFFTAGMDSNRYDEAVKRALAPLEKYGLLKELKHTEGSQVWILVRSQESNSPTVRANVDEVRIDKVKVSLPQR